MIISSAQFSRSVVSDCNSMDCSTPGLPVHHQLPEFTQTHVHRVSDAIQPFHPLLSPSPPTFNLSQHQSLFKWVTSSHQVAKVLEFQLQHQSFQWIFRTDFLQNGLVGSPCCPRHSQESSLEEDGQLCSNAKPKTQVWNTVSPLQMNFQVANFQRFKGALPQSQEWVTSQIALRLLLLWVPRQLCCTYEVDLGTCSWNGIPL